MVLCGGREQDNRGEKKVNSVYMGGMAQEKVKGQELKETELKRI